MSVQSAHCATSTRPASPSRPSQVIINSIQSNHDELTRHLNPIGLTLEAVSGMILSDTTPTPST